MDSAPGYLVQYGRAAYVGRFTMPDDVACFAPRFARAERVVVRTPRGIEIGTVLCEATDRFARHLAPASGGEVLRVPTKADEAGIRNAEDLARRILEAADSAGLPIAFADAESMLDGPVILHAIPFEKCDADPLLTELAERFHVPVRLLDVSRTPAERDAPEPTSGCGKPGCGTEGGGCSTGGCGTGGGCSTGSCSRGKVRSAEDLTSYFADLRAKMEAADNVRTSLR